jgi:hypothetical protein
MNIGIISVAGSLVIFSTFVIVLEFVITSIGQEILYSGETAEDTGQELNGG